MAMRLFYRFRSANGILPALPYDSSLDMAPVGRPEHGYVQRHGGHIIKDEGKGGLVTNKLKAVAGLAGGKQENSQEKQKRILQSEDDQQKRKPRGGGLQLANKRPRGAANQPV